jgi:hypothetical protein
MDTGTVVWLPDGGFGEDYNAACQETYGPYYYACGEEPWNGGLLVYCCY